MSIRNINFCCENYNNCSRRETEHRKEHFTGKRTKILININLEINLRNKQTMQKLMYDNFIMAKNYIFENSEHIDRALFRYVFEDKDEDAFLDILEKYQCDNGGFG